MPHQLTNKSTTWRTCIFPLVTYSCELWTISQLQRKKNMACELICNRNLLRTPWIMKKKNTVTLQDVKIKENWLINSIISSHPVTFIVGVKLGALGLTNPTQGINMHDARKPLNGFELFC